MDTTPLLAALLMLGLSGCSAKKKSADHYFSICSRSDPRLNDCVLRTLTEVKPKFVQGIPDLSFPPIDPLHIKKMAMNDTRGNFKFYMAFIETDVTGFRDYKVEKVSVDSLDPNNVQISWKMTSPRLIFSGQYEMSGQLLVIPIKGDGDFNFNISSVTVEPVLRGRVVTRDGLDHLEVTDLKWPVTVGRVRSHFSNLFNGDKQLGEATNRFLNENFRDVWSTYSHLPEQAFAEYFKEVASRVLRALPWDTLMAP